jgi:hypothetical protein
MREARGALALVLALIVLAACHTSDAPAPEPDLIDRSCSIPDILNAGDAVSPDGALTVWGEWHVPDEYEIWLSGDGESPRLLVTMPIAPTLTVPALMWEDTSHILHIQTSSGGGASVTHIWRISLDGSLDELCRESKTIAGS